MEVEAKIAHPTQSFMVLHEQNYNSPDCLLGHMLETPTKDEEGETSEGKRFHNEQTTFAVD